VCLVRSAEEIVSLLEKPDQLVAPVVVNLSEIFRDVKARVVNIEEARRAKAARKPRRSRRRKQAAKVA